MCCILIVYLYTRFVNIMGYTAWNVKVVVYDTFKGRVTKLRHFGILIQVRDNFSIAARHTLCLYLC
jgi:hypothetical protein